MNVWIPGLIVVAVGLAAGLWFALRGKPAGTEGNALGAGGGSVPEAPGAPRQAAAGAAGLPASADRRSGLVGFLFGVGTCLVVGGLVYWATQGSRPKDEMSSGGAPDGHRWLKRRRWLRWLRRRRRAPLRPPTPPPRMKRAPSSLPKSRPSCSSFAPRFRPRRRT